MFIHERVVALQSGLGYTILLRGMGTLGRFFAIGTTTREVTSVALLSLLVQRSLSKIMVYSEREVFITWGAYSFIGIVVGWTPLTREDNTFFDRVCIH